MDTLLNLASDLGDISAEEERGADRLHASIFMPAVPSEEPPPRDAAAELASTEHLVNLLANLSDARESFAAAWDDASRSSRGEEPPPEPPAAEKRSDALARAARARSDLARRPSLRAFVADHEKKSEGLARAARAKRATVERRGPASPTKQRARASELASSHLAAREAREAARLAKIEEEIAESCTFRPALATRDAPPPPPGAKTAAAPPPPPPAEVSARDALLASARLHAEAGERRELRCLRQVADAEAKALELPFRPTINENSGGIALANRAAGASGTNNVPGPRYDRRPLHERVADVERAARARRETLESRLRDESAPSFAPEINRDEGSRRMAARAATKMLRHAADASARLGAEAAASAAAPDVAARLAADAWRRSVDRRARLDDDRAAAAAAAAAAVRLGTKPSRGSEAILQKGDLAPFAERERRRAVERRDAARETRETRERELRETCFKPEISARSRALDDVAEARRRAEEKHGVYDPSRSRAAPDAEPASRVALRAAKLAKDAAKADARKAKLRAARDAEHSFKPTLNERTKATDYKASTKALAENARGKQQREKLEAEGRARRAADCPFRPTLAAAPRRLVKSARTDAERKRDRDDKHRAALKQRELDELMECSFQPFTNNRQKREARPQSATGRPTAVRPVVVRGLARHLENRQRAAALAEEKRTREHAAFHVAKAEEWRQGQNHTKVEPFALST